jgi:hypothetical protein
LSQRWHHSGRHPRCRCHCCRHGAGIITALASLQMLLWCRLGIVAVAALASSRTLPWHCCQRRCHGAGIICGRCPGAVAIVAIAMLASLWRWHHRGGCPGTAWVSPPLQCWRHCGRCPGAVVIVAVAMLASSWRWRHRGRCPGAAWASLPSRRWCHRGRHPGAVAIFARGFDTAFDAASPT